MRFRLLAAFAALFIFVQPARSQQFEIQGADRDSTAMAIRDLLDRRDYTLIDRDTILEADASIPGDLVVVDARVALEGRVEGEIAVIRGDFFVRPRAYVGGRILVVDGGAYPSALAEMGEILYVDPRVNSSLDRQPPNYLLLLYERLVGVLRVPGAFGVQLPTYDRVDGLAVSWSGGLGFGGRDTASLALTGTARYSVERKRPQGNVELRIRPSYLTAISLSASRRTRTNENWIRGPLANTASSAFAHSDVRNYYESDEISATVAEYPFPALIQGERYFAPRLTLRLSRDRSLPAAEVWSLFGDEPWRYNPSVDEGTLGSVVAGATAGWRGISTQADGSFALEWSPGGIGDFEFATVEALGTVATLGPYNHQIEVSGYILYPLGTAYVPRQRWSFVGGPGTLNTLETGALRGDHVALIEASYVARWPQINLPVIGPLTTRFEYAAGSAWTGGDIPPLVQNVGAGLQFMVLTGMVYVDPSAEQFDPTYSFGVQIAASPVTSIF